MPAGTLVGVFVWGGILGLVLRRTGPPPAAPELDPKELKRVLLVMAALVLLQWPAALGNTGFIGYTIRVIGAAIPLVPFVAGLYAKRVPGVHRVWLITLGIQFVVGMAVGSRSNAILPAAYYFIGFLVSARGALRRRYATAIIVGFFPLLYVASGVGAVRERIGRGGIEIFSVDRLEMVVETFFSNSQGEGTTKALVTNEGIGRLVVWPNVAVTLLTPTLVRYRGFDSFAEEAVQSFQISFVSGVGAADYIASGARKDFGLVVANDYGFMVNELTSVNFGTLADGWSRGGAWSALMFGMILSVVFMGLERILQGLRMTSPAWYLVLICVLCRAAMNAPVDPLLFLIRAVCMHLAMFLIVFVVFRALTNLQPEGRSLVWKTAKK
jgi:hypothetical protein